MNKNAIKFLTRTTEMTPQSFRRTSTAGNPIANDRAAKTHMRLDLNKNINFCVSIVILSTWEVLKNRNANFK
tara:strand:- start:403 stop:618 length:216 start_codon:yes stop_codon:yes gene_type:complete